MGAGNYYPHLEAEYKMLYVTFPENDESYLWWQDLRDCIYNALPNSVCQESGWHNEIHLLASNGLLQVGTADNQWGTAVVVLPKLDRDTDLPMYAALASRHMPALYKRIANALKQSGYELSVRCGPWTSAPYGG